ncbi:hypothetical protein Bca101_059498 [Brassica carinata]
MAYGFIVGEAERYITLLDSWMSIRSWKEMKEMLWLKFGAADDPEKHDDCQCIPSQVDTIDMSWSSIKKSVRRVNVVFTGQYQRNMQRLEPPESCHVNDMDNYCVLSFYYKKIKQFIAIL